MRWRAISRLLQVHVNVPCQINLPSHRSSYGPAIWFHRQPRTALSKKKPRRLMSQWCSSINFLGCLCSHGSSIMVYSITLKHGRIFRTIAAVHLYDRPVCNGTTMHRQPSGYQLPTCHSTARYISPNYSLPHVCFQHEIGTLEYGSNDSV